MVLFCLASMLLRARRSIATSASVSSTTRSIPRGTPDLEAAPPHLADRADRLQVSAHCHAALRAGRTRWVQLLALRLRCLRTSPAAAERSGSPEVWW